MSGPLRPPLPPPPAPPLPVSIPQRSALSARQYPEPLDTISDDLKRACALAGVSATEQYQLHNLPSILQAGPTCGLTALSMLVAGDVTTEELLEMAITRKYSLNGEMFSAVYTMQLLREVFAKCSSTATVSIFSGQLDSKYIRDKLMAGAALLIPYDADFDHRPCLKNGHKAHWCLAIGCLIDIRHEFYLIVRHGKSRHLMLSPLSAFSESNANLREFSKPAKHPNDAFLLPPDGIAGPLGLCGQSILIEGLREDLLTNR